MSRTNNVRGPTSALTEFLRESGITPTTVARRVATRDQQPIAGPSGTQANGEEEADQWEDDGEASRASPRRRTRAAAGYASDELDEPEGEHEEKPTIKKRKLTKAAEAKLKAKEMAKKTKGNDDNGDRDGDDSEDDVYNALSKSFWTDNGSKPPVGNFENCARCEKQFTVTKYTIAANPGPGFLCHQCAKASGSDPFKKATPKKKKAPVDKRTVVNFEEKRFPTLVSMCIQLISKHINDIEALGDIGGLNMEAICKALAKNRNLTTENANLFYNITNTSLTLYDATNLPSSAFTTLSYLNPNLTSLRLDFCGRLDSLAMQSLSASLPALTHLELLGPFLVRIDAWIAFLSSHPHLRTFCITQSPRFDLGCMRVLADSCGDSLEALRLREVGKLDDEFLDQIKRMKKLKHLDIAEPAVSCSEEAIIELMVNVGASLTTLDLSKHDLLTDEFLERGMKPYTRVLDSLALSHLPELTNTGVAGFFQTWENGPLTSLDMARNHELGTEALNAVMVHSGSKLVKLVINGWKDVGEEALRMVGRHGVELKRVDVGWCRQMDDFVVKSWMGMDKEHQQGSAAWCRKLEELKVWGCNRITASCPRKKGVSIYGVESHTTL
ncbi:RNI-like protein [Tricholoma matsutake]|nr:RNI-like protein [Tricholoma matsutake 945]